MVSNRSDLTTQPSPHQYLKRYDIYHTIIFVAGLPKGEFYIKKILLFSVDNEDHVIDEEWEKPLNISKVGFLSFMCNC